MRRPATLLLLLLMAGCGSSAEPARAPRRPARAPAATMRPGDLPDGAARAVTGATLHVVPFRIIADAGLSRARCGVVIGQQRVETLGAGDLDAYTCIGLRDAHALPDGAVGLLYDAESPNTRLRTAAVLRRDPSGRWTVEPEATTTYDDLSVKSWPAFAAALGHGGRR